MKLHTLLSQLQNIKWNVEENPEILSIEMDSREVKQDSLFICISGYTVDGHDYAEQAVRNGAAAVLSEKPLDLPVPVVVVKNTKRAMALLADAFYGHPTQGMHLIGVTGTNGKTSTTHLIEKFLKMQGKQPA